jgi:ankyrin repeat protein
LQKFQPTITLNNIKLLIENGADVKEKNNSAICLAAYYGDLETFIYLKECGGNIHANNNEPFFNAVGRNLDIVKYLVQLGYNYNIPPEGYLGGFPGQACDHFPTLYYFVNELKLNPHLDEDAAFAYACRSGNLECVKLLLNHGADIHNQDNRSLIFACELNHEHIVDFLLENKVNLGINPSKILEVASAKSNTSILNKLVTYGMKPEFSQSLTAAINDQNILNVEYLIDLGCDMTQDKGFLIQSADRTDNYEIVELCMRKGLPQSYIEQYSTSKFQSYLLQKKLSNSLSEKTTTHSKLKI